MIPAIFTVRLAKFVIDHRDRQLRTVRNLSVKGRASRPAPPATLHAQTFNTQK